MIPNRLYTLLVGAGLLVLLSTQLMAQQLPLFSMYRHQSTLLNPAALPSDYFARDQNLTFGAAYRRQWTGIDNAPTTQTLHGNYFFKDLNGFAPSLGGYLMNDQTGPTGMTGLYVNGGGFISEDPYYSGIGIGLSFGLVQYRLNTAELRLRDPGDILLGETQTQLFPDVGLGVFAYGRLGNDDLIYGGVSLPQVLGLNLAFRGENGEFETQRVRHYYANAGFYHFLDNDNFIEPSVWVRYVNGADISVDLNVRYQMVQNLYIGAGGNSSGAFHVETGLMLGDTYTFDNTFQIGYSFTRWFSQFGPDAGPTHEFNLSVGLDR